MPGELLTDKQMIENAKLTLNRLDVVGFVEELSAFADQLKCAIGCKVKFRRLNPSSASDKAMTLLDELRPAIEEFCAPDIEIYQYARSIRKPASNTP